MNESAKRQISEMDDSIALPRKNGVLVFETPWEARAFGIAAALNQGGAYEWRDFGAELAKEIAGAESEAGDSTYYEHWLEALENLARRNGLVREEELQQKRNTMALEAEHEH